MFRISRLLSCFLGSMFVVTASPKSFAFSIPIDFGIDGQTLGVVEHFPSDMRAQLFALIEQTLPLIDASVDRYLDKLNFVISENVNNAIDHASCNLTGGGYLLGAEASNSFLHLFVGPSQKAAEAAGVPQSVELLRSEVEKTRAGISPRSPIAQIGAAYSDLLIHAGLVACAARSVGSATSVSMAIGANISSLDTSSMEWEILATSDFCRLPYECLQKRVAGMDAFLASQDVRDTKTVDAYGLISALPPMPPPPTFAQNHSISSYDIAPVENLLIKIRGIERRVALAKRMREIKAAESFKAAQALLPAFDQYLRNEVSEINSPTSPVDYSNLLTRAPSLRDNANAIGAASDLARTGDARYAQLDSQIQIYLSKARENIDTMVAVATYNLDPNNIFRQKREHFLRQPFHNSNDVVRKHGQDPATRSILCSG